MATNTFIERQRTFCALGGALLTVTALPDTVPILHAAMGCATSIYFNQIGSTGYLGAGYCGGTATPSSNVGENEIVFGGLDRLREQVANTLEIVDGNLYIILTGCMTDIIGDDIQSIVREFRAEGKPIIGAETGGFKGDGYRGYDLILQALFRDFVEHGRKKVPNSVNLWGIVPGQDPFWRGNLRYLTDLLGRLGLRVNTFFGADATLDDLKNAAEASLNIVVSRYYGIEAAQLFEEIHGTPFLSTALPIGPTATATFLRQVAAALSTPDTAVEALIAEEKRCYYRNIERIADAYNDLDFQRYAVVIGDANYAPAITAFLGKDFGWLPELTVVTDDLPEDRRDLVIADVDDPASGYATGLVFETDASEMARHLAEKWPRSTGQPLYDAFSPAFVVGSSLDREFALGIGAAHLSVSFPVGNRVILNRGYTGYEGAMNLIEDLLSVVVASR
jgi:nitrogenase molybdenum-iron protein beta chain